MGGRADDHANDNETCTDDGNITTADQIREGADKRTDGCKGKKISQNLMTLATKIGKGSGLLLTYKPNPPIQATEVTVNIGRNASYIYISNL